MLRNILLLFIALFFIIALKFKNDFRNYFILETVFFSLFKVQNERKKFNYKLSNDSKF